MKRRLYVSAAVLVLLTALVATGCSPSPDTSGEGSVSSFVRAMSQAISVDTADNSVTEISTNEYSVKNFKADDGSYITGTFKTDSEGNVIDAALTLTYSDGTPGPIFVLKTEGNTQDVTIDTKPVSPSEVPKTMTAPQRRAFRGFTEGLEEVLDDLNDDLIEPVEEVMEREGGGTHPIPSRFNMEGTVTHMEEWDDGEPEAELIGADIESFAINRNGAEISGSYSFSERGDNERAEMDIRFQNYRADDDIIFIDIVIDAAMSEGEVRGDDTFTFNGSISGRYSIYGREHTIEFNGKMDAMEDEYIRFPEYTLRIDGDNVALGRQSKNGSF